MNKITIPEWDMKFNDDKIPYVYIKNNNVLDRKLFNNLFEEFEFNDIRNVYTMLINIYDIHHLSEEYGIIVAFRGGKLLGTYILSKGTDMSCDANLRIIYKFLLLVGANSFIFVHNHPFEELKISEEDFVLTKCLIESSNLLDFEFINHILIANNDWICIVDELREREI